MSAKIYINDLEISTVIGVFEFERMREQRVLVDFECEYSYKNSYLDYSEVAQLIEITIKREEYHSLEDAITDLAGVLSNSFHNIKSMKIKITKPDILKNCKVAVEKEFSKKDLS